MSNKPIIYVRAGHSGIDPTTGVYLTMRDEHAKFYKHKNGKPYHENGFFYEGVSNRLIADKFIKLARETGFEVVQVHHAYQDIKLNITCNSVNEHYRAHGKGRPAIFLDIHSNAGQASGLALLYYPGYVKDGVAINAPSIKGKKLAEDMAQELNPVWLNEGAKYGTTPVRAGWIYRNSKIVAPYYMVQYTSMPSIIIENGFFDNEHDADLLMQDCFQDKLAQGILMGCLRNFGYDTKITI
jgi:N-acetylmuramoyl-L-alanine amidase